MSKYSVGLRNVGSYQVSGAPYQTGSATNLTEDAEVRYQFPYVTKSVMVHHYSGGGNLYVHFQSASAGTITGKHYVELQQGMSFTFNVKCKEIYITSKNDTDNRVQIVAELTNIPTSNMFHLTGSGVTTTDGT